MIETENKVYARRCESHVEALLAACLIWFGIATPLPVVRGVENAVAIVLDQDTDALHTAPMFREFFGSEATQSEVE